MAVVRCRIGASPDSVFAVLSDGWQYSGWVVGASHMRAVSADWPSVGSRLFHASGAWPVLVRDETEVLEMEPGRRLVMKAKGKAMGAARIEITLDPSDGETVVTLEETPVEGAGKWLNNPLAEQLLRRRNVEALARLTARAEQPTQPKD